MDLRLSGKRALVTGASKGIGRAVAEVLAEEGGHVDRIGRTPQPLEQAAAQPAAGHLQATFRAIPADLSLAADRARVAQLSGDADILVGNAGANPSGRLADVPDDVGRSRCDELRRRNRVPQRLTTMHGALAR